MAAVFAWAVLFAACTNFWVNTNCDRVELFVNLTALDADGNEVPDCNERLYFTLDGEGAILGVGNGDPLDHDADLATAAGWTVASSTAGARSSCVRPARRGRSSSARRATRCRPPPPKSRRLRRELNRKGGE